MSMLSLSKKVSHFIMLTTMGVTSVRARAATADDLALQCGGTYKVLTSEAYFKDNTGTRAPNFAGTDETIEVLTVVGKDCAKIAQNYGVSVKVGQVLDYGMSTGEDYSAAKALAKARLGKSFSYAATQSFTYAVDGTLPLFPKVHEEHLQMLSLEGSADAKALYGTPAIAELSDAEILGIHQEILSIVEWGKLYEQKSWSDQWLEFLLAVEPKATAAKKEYAHLVVSFLFENATRFSGTFTTFSPGMVIGQKANSLLNELGGTKWATKMHVWKHHPLLFDSQIVSWARFDPEPAKAPLLSAEELEEWLTFAWDQVQALKKVNWVGEANTVLYQFQHAVQSIAAATKPNGSQPPLYTLTPASEVLLAQLLAFR